MDNNLDSSPYGWCPPVREGAVKIFKAGVEAADPYNAVKNALTVNNGQIRLGLDSPGQPVRIGTWNKVRLIAIGKAACAMADAAQAIIPDQKIAGMGLAVTNYENVRAVSRFEVTGAGHPLPDNSGHQAAKKIARYAAEAKSDELVLVLVSGGGSALAPYPVDTITLEEKIATTCILLACGADINQINCVRKHLSRLKGGGLARIASPAAVHSLILSDVLGNDLSSIASGPTIPDPTTFQDAIEVFRNKRAWYQLPPRVRAHLDAGFGGKTAETPKPGDSEFEKVGHTLIGSNRISVDAIARQAEHQDYETQIYSDALCGEARDEAEKLAVHAKKLMQEEQSSPIAVLAGGETTVTLKGNGRGGRNQEMALAFALAAERHGLEPRWVFLSGGTDGRDGPTDAAGGIVDPGSIQRMRANGLDNPQAFLDNNDSYVALKRSDDLLDTGATGTNVADLQVLLIYPKLYH